MLNDFYVSTDMYVREVGSKTLKEQCQENFTFTIPILDSDLYSKTCDPLLRNDDEERHVSVWIRTLADTKTCFNMSQMKLSAGFPV